MLLKYRFQLSVQSWLRLKDIILANTTSSITQGHGVIPVSNTAGVIGLDVQPGFQPASNCHYDWEFAKEMVKSVIDG